MATATVRLDSEQFAKINKLRGTELATAFTTILPLFGLFIAMWEGYLATIWQYALGYFLFYCVTNFVVHRIIINKMDAVLSKAEFASDGEQIVLPGFFEIVRNTFRESSDVTLKWQFVFCSSSAIVGVFVLLGPFIGIQVSKSLEIPWYLSLLFGIGGAIIFGIYGCVAFQEIRRRAAI